MQQLPTIATLELFPILHEKLITLLRSLSAEDWHRPTVCKDWSVKDIASHLLDGNLRRITLYRDQYQSPEKPDIRSYRDLVDYLNQLNNSWVRATRRFSPRIITDLLEQTGEEVNELFNALPPNEPAIFSVAWAGQDTSPNWFHIAREYTENWHHQQQIRLAVDQPDGIMTAELYYPLLDTFMRALPHTYREIPAEDGTLLQVSVTGEGGGNWYLYRQQQAWQLLYNPPFQHPSDQVTIDGKIAWRLFTKGISREAALPYVSIDGNRPLGEHVLSMLSVMA
ncbi:maleylpyruvate isomerase family mycothiol-dependent enzyme [Nibrella saemangeumensis]|uniref:Maleylpyruvate isomerase family mycothiol-dependent enzyme n=1 Tax=Nibrella saemangeumensis TaxID=1084526 RepID=A0ABP8MZ08_9BACT